MSSDLENPNFDSLITINNSFSDIRFFDKGHYYEIDGEKAIMSVSKLISKYEKPFDSEKIAKNVARREGITTKEILDKWNFSKEYSCHKGSEFHLFVENFFERRKIQIDKQAVELFLKLMGKPQDMVLEYYGDMAHLIVNFMKFYEWWKQDHILIKSEFVIGDLKTTICGTIDNLSYNTKTKELVIFDYKTNKEIKKEGYKGETMLGCLNHVPKCELSKYSLQLELYKLIFERNCPYKISKSYIVWVAGQENELIPTLDYKKEAQMMLDEV